MRRAATSGARRSPADAPTAGVLADRALGAQLFDVVFRETQELAQDFRGVLAGQRRRRRRRRRGRQVHRAARQPDAAARLVLDRVNLAAGIQVRVVENLARVQDGAAGHARLAQGTHHLVLRARARPRADDPVQLVAVLPARLRVLQARVGQPLLAADGGREVTPHARADRLHVDERVVVGPAGRARVSAAGHAADQPVAAPRARLALAIVIDEATPQQVRDRFLHRDLDELALAGALALDIGGHDRGGGVHAGAGVADGGAAADGLAILEPGHAHDAARRLGDHVEALVLAVRAGEPEALDAGHDDARVRGVQPLVVETEFLHHAGSEVLDGDVGPLDPAERQRAPIRVLQVDRDATLVGVEDEEEHRVEPRHLRPVAARLLTAGRLDLQHVGAQPA